MADYEKFFRDYIDVFNRSMAGEVDTDAIRASYAEFIVSAGANGAVQGGANDDKYAEVLRKGAEFYRALRMQAMELRRVEASPIDEGHDLVRAFFTARHTRRDGTPVSIDFDVSYMLQKRKRCSQATALISGAWM